MIKHVMHHHLRLFFYLFHSPVAIVLKLCELNFKFRLILTLNLLGYDEENGYWTATMEHFEWMSQNSSLKMQI